MGKRIGLADLLREKRGEDKRLDSAKDMLDNIEKKSQERDDPQKNEHRKNVKISRLIDHSMHQSVDYSVHQSVDHSDRTVDRTVNQPVNHSVDRTVNQSIDNSVGQSINHSIDQSVDKSVQNLKQHSEKIKCFKNGLTERQVIVLKYLTNHKTGIMQIGDISINTNISTNSINKIINVLLKLGYIKSKNRYRFQAYQGTKFTLNDKLCNDFFSTSVDHSIHQSVDYSVHQSIDDSIHHLVDQTDSSNSKYVSNKNKELNTYLLFDELNSHPEMEFWRQQRLTEKMIHNGLKKTKVTEEIFLQSMKHAAFFFVEKNGLSKINTANPFQYMIGGIIKEGIFVADKDYESWEEKQLRITKEILEKNKKIKAELELVQTEQVEVEKEIKALKNSPWLKIKASVEKQLNASEQRLFNTVMKSAKIHLMDDGKITIVAADSFVKKKIKAQFLSMFEMEGKKEGVKIELKCSSV